MAKIYFVLEDEKTPYGTIVDVPGSMIDDGDEIPDGQGPSVYSRAKTFIINSLRSRGVPYDRTTIDVTENDYVGFMTYWRGFD